jgi:Glycine rich protein
LSLRGRRSIAKITSVLAFSSALGGALAFPASGTAAISHFGYTGGAQTWVVPTGVTSARFDIYGAAGGEPYVAGFNAGKGGHATARVPLTPGSTVQIVVGGKGGYPGAGYNGGGDGRRFGGGGATDIRIGGTGLNDRVLVAGGGGGVGDYSGTGGAGGGLAGTAGSGGFGGGGGTQTAGGSGTYPDWSGSFGQGGGAGGGPNVTGGGGGGWYGGAGGPGGGGGGSGHGPEDASFGSAISGGNGSATIAVGPPRGRYYGRVEGGYGYVSFHLSHDYQTVQDFKWYDNVYLRKATFHQTATGGSFDAWDANDRHYWGHWGSEHSRNAVKGGFSYPHHGHRIERQFAAYADSPRD